MLISLLQSLAEAPARRIADAFSRPLEALREEPPHKRTSTDDARIQLDTWVQRKQVQLGILAAAASGAVAVIVPSNLSLPWSALVAAVAAAIAAAVVPATAFVIFWITAPARQRDEARAALAQQPRAKEGHKSPGQTYLQAQRVTKRLEERRAERLKAEVQDELVATIDQGRALNKNAFDRAGYGPFKLWHEKTVRFIETVLGPLESQRFGESYDPSPLAFSEVVEHRLKRLADLRDRPETWRTRVDRAALRDACELRRHVSQADLIVLAGDSGGAAQVPQRLDRAALAAEIRELGANVEMAIDERGTDEELEIAAMERRAAGIGPLDALQKLAKSKAAEETRDILLSEYGKGLSDAIGAAVELGAVARLDREQFVHPDGNGIKHLPDSLRRIADRLDAFEAPAD